MIATNPVQRAKTLVRNMMSPAAMRSAAVVNGGGGNRTRATSPQVLGSYDKSFYAFDAATGAMRWRFTANGPISGSATVLNGVVYFSTFNERTYALDAATGRLRWTWPDGKYSPVVSDTRQMYFTGLGRLYAMVEKRSKPPRVSRRG